MKSLPRFLCSRIAFVGEFKFYDGFFGPNGGIIEGLKRKYGFPEVQAFKDIGREVLLGSGIEGSNNNSKVTNSIKNKLKNYPISFLEFLRKKSTMIPGNLRPTIIRLLFFFACNPEANKRLLNAVE